MKFSPKNLYSIRSLFPGPYSKYARPDRIRDLSGFGKMTFIFLYYVFYFIFSSRDQPSSICYTFLMALGFPIIYCGAAHTAASVRAGDDKKSERKRHRKLIFRAPFFTMRPEVEAEVRAKK